MTPDGARMAGRMLRAVRYSRRLSQRELADVSGARREAVARIEAEKVVPRVDTLVTILAGAGYALALVDHRGRVLELDPTRDALVDRAGRHLPSHLRPEPTPDYFEPGGRASWWGWHHIAWPFTDDWVPEYTYWKRPPPLRNVEFWRSESWTRLWDDAT
ncbi:helix-turn-helix transcriptional regulator [Jatrophihabitans endophyticus]|uniref:helix-turn-helix transcriptional regulator n=1 Tax=Jatrophihabitans endophyticus TaxID=1206085 RepID=UPI0034CF0B94